MVDCYTEDISYPFFFKQDNDVVAPADDPSYYFDNQGLFLIRARFDYSYPGPETIESSIKIAAWCEMLLVTLDSEGALGETFVMNADDSNRLHVNRGRLMHVKRGDVIARGLFVYDHSCDSNYAPLPFVLYAHGRLDPIINRIEVNEDCRRRVENEMQVQQISKVSADIKALETSFAAYRTHVVNLQQGAWERINSITSCQQVASDCFASFLNRAALALRTSENGVP